MSDATTPTPDDVDTLVHGEPFPERAHVAKQVARTVVGTSVRFVVAGAISHVVPIETKKDKLKLAIGTYAISGVLSKACKQYVVEQMDYYLGVTDELKVLRLNYMLSQQVKAENETPTS